MAEQLAEKAGDSWENGGKHTSGAKAPVESVGFIAGDESPAYPNSSLSAACEVMPLHKASLKRVFPPAA